MVAPLTVPSSEDILSSTHHHHPRDILKQTGEISITADAEGATAPETLRQKDRRTSTSGE
jgi:hypothetical protein